MKRLRVGIILAQRFTLAALAVFCDRLKTATERSRGTLCIELIVMSSGTRRLPSSTGELLQPVSALLPADAVDAVVVVGDDEIVAHCQVDDATERYLQEIARTTTPIVGIGGGIFILCRAGILKGRKLCVASEHHRTLVEMFPRQPAASDRTFIVDGTYITCVGASGAAQLAHYLVQNHVHRARMTPLWLMSGTSLGSEESGGDVRHQIQDHRVHRCLALMEQTLSQPRAIRAISASMGISTRHLERLFRKWLGISPQEVYRRLRMHHAVWQIENTDRAIIDIAFDSGFGSSSHFARRFKKVYGHAPSVRRSLRRSLRQRQTLLSARVEHTRTIERLKVSNP